MRYLILLALLLVQDVRYYGTALGQAPAGVAKYDKTVNMPGLVMFLQLGEPAGAIKGDYAGNFPFLEKVDGVGTITSAAGKIGNATEFSGETSYIQPTPNSVAGDGKIAMPTGDFTVSMWFYPKAGTGNQYLFSYGENFVSGTVTLHMWNNLPMGVRCFTTAATPAETANLPVINSWNYVSCWHDSATHTNYVQLNGGAIASAAGVEAALPQYTRIARHAGAGANFVGIIDAVGVWNRILTVGEQTANQAGIEPPF